MGNVWSRVVVVAVVELVRVVEGMTCAECTGGDGWWCVGSGGRSCVGDWELCPNGTTVFFGPKTRTCPTATTTTTTTPPSSSSSSSTFYFVFSVVVMVVVGVIAVVVVGLVVVRRQEWARRQREERRRMGERLLGGEPSGVAYRELERAVEENRICLTRGSNQEEDRIRFEEIQVDLVAPPDLSTAGADSGSPDEEIDLFSRF